MFYLVWAVKNLKKNYTRTIRNTLFIMVISCMLVLIFGFRRGAREQLQASLQAEAGDVFINAKREEYSLTGLAGLLQERFEEKIKVISGGLSLSNCLFVCDDLYEYGTLNGVGEEFFRINKDHLYWEEGRPFLEGGVEAVVEKSYAKTLRIKAGDLVTVRRRTKEGMYNTVQLQISGIFIGNEYLHGYSLFTSLEEARLLELDMEKEKLNQLRVYLADPDDEALLFQVVKTVEEEARDEVNVQVLKWDTGSFGIMQLFSVVSLIMGIVLSLVSVTLLIVLFFALHNTFYLLFHSRTAELSALLPFGMKYSALYKVAFWETIILIGLGSLGGLGLAILTAFSLRHLPLTGKLSEMVAILGGPYLRFLFLPEDLGVVLVFIVITGLWASWKALRNYLRREIREIMSIGY